jgi:hypothetical protein
MGMTEPSRYIKPILLFIPHHTIKSQTTLHPKNVNSKRLKIGFKGRSDRQRETK